MAAMKRLNKEIKNLRIRDPGLRERAFKVLRNEKNGLQIAVLIQPKCSHCREPSQPCQDPPERCYCELSPYAEGTFIMTITLPPDYPFKAPTEVKYSPPISSPYADGGVLGTCWARKYSPAMSIHQMIHFHLNNVFEPLGRIAAGAIRATNHPACSRLLGDHLVRDKVATSKRLLTVLLGTCDSGSPLFALCHFSYLLEKIWGHEQESHGQFVLDLMEGSPRWPKMLEIISDSRSPEELEEEDEGCDDEAGAGLLIKVVDGLSKQEISDSKSGFELGLGNKIGTLKRLIQTQPGTHRAITTQRIVFAGRELKGSRTLAEHGVTGDCTMHLIWRMGCKKDPESGSELCIHDLDAFREMTEDWDAFCTKQRQYVAQECQHEQMLARFTQQGVWPDQRCRDD